MLLYKRLTNVRLCNIDSSDLLICALPTLRRLVFHCCKIVPTLSLMESIRGLKCLTSLCIGMCTALHTEPIQEIFPFRISSQSITSLEVDEFSLRSMKPLLGPIMFHFLYLHLSDFRICFDQTVTLCSWLNERCDKKKLKEIEFDGGTLCLKGKGKMMKRFQSVRVDIDGMFLHRHK